LARLSIVVLDLTCSSVRHVGAGAVRHFGRHADRFAQRRVRVDGLADIDRVAAHFDGQADFADHVAGVRADDAPPMTRCVSASKISLVKP
jgi:hypothetical protein